MLDTGATGAPFLVGYAAGSTGTMDMNNSATITVTNATYIGGGTGGNGTMTMNNSAILNQNGDVVMGEGAGSVGILTLNGSATVNQAAANTTYMAENGGTATININDNAKYNAGTMWVGHQKGDAVVNVNSTDTLDPATLTVGLLWVSFDENAGTQTTNGTVNVSGTGKLVAAGLQMGIYAGHSAIVNMSDNAEANIAYTYFGQNGGHAELNMSGSQSITTGEVQLSNGGGDSQINMTDDAKLVVTAMPFGGPRETVLLRLR